ncbi:MAG: cob(I)yrinic acid a,c-diamide adenosyltransferase [Opitutaceae bacterium]|jgi:cob(I)alamin adenosyltransferase|nr:cob(I)yrinic acid a,c-diamide adenosyltransferase [Opitutaceae bacterium]
MASISTRKGDDGTTGLLYGQRVEKDHPQIEAVGALDELNTSLGAAKTVLVGHSREAEVRVLLETVQRNLVALMGEIACAESDASRYAASSFIKVAAADIARLDEAVATLESRGLRFDGWATPGANPLSAALDVARTVCRRAERRLTALPRTGRHVRPELRQFINRLADLLWLLAREAEQ